jgi:putative ABC transport system ATP-binding protein
MELMHGLHEGKRITFLFSTHDRNVMMRAERLIRLKDGRVAADGAPADVVDAV